jgi:hypothetical protein
MKKLIKKNKLFITLFIFVISFSLFLLLFFRIDYDYFWHIKAGEYMFNNGILRYDVFSWFTSSKYWMSHEWLFEIIIYCLKLVFGDYHVIVYTFITLTILLLIFLFSNKRNFLKNIPYTLIYFLFFFILIINYLQCRPHLVSFSLLALTIYFLYDLYLNENSRKIYFLPIITIFWANVHGGSSNLPYLMCLIFIIGGLFSFKFTKIEAKRFTKKQFSKYLIVMFLCMISVCINIHGFKMFIYPYENMADSVMLSNISEWRSTSLNELLHYEYYIFLLFLIFTMLFSNKKIQFIDLILLGFVTYLGLKSIRFWIYTYIVMTYVIFNYVKAKKLDNNTIQGIGIFSLFLIVMFICNIGEITNIKFSTNISEELVSVLKSENPSRLFNMYDYGGELIYNDIPVFIDGRADLYTKYNYKDYLNISNLNGDYVKLIEKYNFDYFLVDKDYSINTYLKYNDQY